MKRNPLSRWTINIVELFEKLGVSFSGILPGALPADASILQFLNNVPLDYSRIRVASRTAKGVLAYVQQLDPNRVYSYCQNK
jgi:serine/threonine-protein kinase RsbW